MRGSPKLAASLTLLAALSLHAQSTAGQNAASATGGRVILVLPFENRSGNASLNWIGESFPDTLDKRLNSAGFLTISHDDRAYALDHLGLPTGFRPSRATAIRVAQQLDANYVVVGSYNVSGQQLTAQAQVLSIDALRLSPAVQDGAQLPQLVNAENAVAWRVARTIDPKFSVAENTFVAAANTVPLPAFENYIRGVKAPTPDERLKRLRDAVASAPTYPAALLALGKEQYAQRDFAAAAATLVKVPKSDRLALEANFYLGLARFNSADYAGAESAFAFLASRLPLSEVVNNQAVAGSRQGKDATPLFQRASTQDPSDEDYHFNLAVSLFRRGDLATARTEADAALRLKPNDTEAAQLRSQLNLATPGTRLAREGINGFAPLERVRRTYSETSYRQAAFQLEQMRDLRLATLQPAERAAQYIQLGNDYLNQGLLPEAEQQFQNALTTGAASAEAHAGLARVRERSGSPAEARQEALSSLQVKQNAPAYLILARLDLSENALSAAAADTSHALQLEPANSAALAMKQNLTARGQAVP